jgi:hypothetical protein
MTVTLDKFRDAFINYDRDYFSYEGYEVLYNYLEEINPNMELDVIAICYEYSEYTLDSLMGDYKEYIDYEIEDEDERKEDFLETLEDYTTVLKVDNDTYIIQNF